MGNNQGQEVERETEEGRLGGGVSRLGNIEYVCMHHHDESKKGFATGREISRSRDSFSANAETIAASTELRLLKLGIGISGSDLRASPSCSKMTIGSSLAAPRRPRYI